MMVDGFMTANTDVNLRESNFTCKPNGFVNLASNRVVNSDTVLIITNATVLSFNNIY